MNRNSRPRWLRGLAGLAGLLSALAGVPLGLIALGQGPPGGVGSWHELTTGLQRPISDAMLLRATGQLCWLIWVLFALAAAIEVAGYVVAAGQTRPRWAVPGFQSWARTLVLTAALLLPERNLAMAATTGHRPTAPVIRASAPPGAARLDATRLDATRVPAVPVPATSTSATSSPARATSTPATSTPATSTPVTRASASSASATSASASSGVATPASAAARHQPYVVRRYDSPWAIAERYLGDGTRWREIRDSEGIALDNGRHGNGGSSARLIHPGEVVLLPADGSASPHPAPLGHQPATPNPAPARAASDPDLDEDPEPAVPARSQPALSIAAQTPPATAYLPSATGTPPAATATTAPGTPPAATATSAPGAPPAAQATSPQGTPSAAPTPSPISAALGPTTTAAATPAVQQVPVPTGPMPGPVSAPRTRHPAASPPTVITMAADHRSLPGGTASALLEAGLVGAAALGVIGVLRQRQSQRRPFGKRIRLPGPELARSELALRAAETPERAVLISQALDLLLRLLENVAFPPPTMFGVVADDQMVEVLLDRPAPPPAPWTASAEGFRWRIQVGDLGPADLIESSAPLPALTSLGRAAAGGADVLINLEAAGVVGIAGNRERATGLLHAMATHLLGAPWAPAVNLILIGFPSGLMPVESVRTAASITEIAKELQATAEIMTSLVAHNGCADAFQARVRGVAGDGWPPLVVLCAEPPGDDEVALLSTIARPGSGVCSVVTHAGTASRWEIDVDARPMPVNPLRLAVEPTILDGADMTNLSLLVRIAEDDSGATLADPPYDRIQLSVESLENQPPGSDAREQEAQLLTGVRTTASPSNDEEPLPILPEPEVLVRVLGSVEVTGAREFKRPKARELVVYLAMHPHGVGEAELDEALWASPTGRMVTSATRDSTVSAARSALGGAARLLPAHGQGREKRYQLGKEVGSDWSQFCFLHRWGRDQRSTGALRRALDMVRGRPFDSVVSGRTYGWIHTEGHGRHIEAEVADAADLAAGLFLQEGDPLSARWAARRGLLADPFTERLWVRLMEAADQLGESREIERIMDEMDVLLELEGDFSGLHPATLAAYDRLSRRHRLSAHGAAGGAQWAGRQPNGLRS